MRRTRRPCAHKRLVAAAEHGHHQRGGGGTYFLGESFLTKSLSEKRKPKRSFRSFAAFATATGRLSSL